MKVKRKTKKQSNGLAVAVVVGTDINTFSLRPHGDYSSFVDATREVAVRRAVEARNKWTASGRCGLYRILTGTLTEEVVTPTNYKLVKLKKGGAQ
jgi:hypothetical protein